MKAGVRDEGRLEGDGPRGKWRWEGGISKEELHNDLLDGSEGRCSGYTMK